MLKLDRSNFYSQDEVNAVATIGEAIGAAATASFCTVSAPVEKTLALGERWYNNQNFPGFPTGPTPLGQGLRAARNLLCNEPPDDVSDDFSTPFTGGQCPGTTYRVTAQSLIDGAPNGPIRTREGPGPIGYIQGSNPNGGSFARITNANDEDWFVSGTSVDGAVTSYRFDEVTPVDGPDDCGNPDEIPPEPYLPGNFTDDPDVTYDPPSGPSVTIPVGLLFAPVVVDVDGEIIVPVEVTFDTDVKVNATLNLNTGDFNFVQDIDLTLPTPTTDPTILPDPGGGSGDDPSPGEESEYTIIGVYTEVTEVTAAFRGQLITPNAATSLLRAPRMGSITFHCEILSAPGLAWTQDIDIKYERQLTYCPIPWGAKGVAVTANIGVTIQTTLVRGESERALLLAAADRAIAPEPAVQV